MRKKEKKEKRLAAKAKAQKLKAKKKVRLGLQSGQEMTNSNSLEGSSKGGSNSQPNEVIESGDDSDGLSAL